MEEGKTENVPLRLFTLSIRLKIKTFSRILK
jgi:hypothetical protein